LQECHAAFPLRLLEKVFQQIVHTLLFLRHWQGDPAFQAWGTFGILQSWLYIEWLFGRGISGSTFTEIGGNAFRDCISLTGVTIGNSVTRIENLAFSKCTSLASVTFDGTISSSGFDSSAFNGLGDLRTKYLVGGIGTYTTTAPVGDSSTWTKQ